MEANKMAIEALEYKLTNTYMKVNNGHRYERELHEAQKEAEYTLKAALRMYTAMIVAYFARWSRV